MLKTFLIFLIILINIPFVSATNDVSTAFSSNGTSIVLTAVWAEWMNVSVQTGSGNTTATITVNAQTNYSVAALYGRIKRDGTIVESFNITKSTYPETVTFVATTAETAGTHYYTFEAYCTSGRLCTIYNRTFTVQYLSTGSYGTGNASYPIDFANTSQVTGAINKNNMPANTAYTNTSNNFTQGQSFTRANFSWQVNSPQYADTSDTVVWVMQSTGGYFYMGGGYFVKFSNDGTTGKLEPCTVGLCGSAPATTFLGTDVSPWGTVKANYYYGDISNVTGLTAGQVPNLAQSKIIGLVDTLNSMNQSSDTNNTNSQNRDNSINTTISGYNGTAHSWTALQTFNAGSNFTDVNVSNRIRAPWIEGNSTDNGVNLDDPLRIYFFVNNTYLGRINDNRIGNSIEFIPYGGDGFNKNIGFVTTPWKNGYFEYLHGDGSNITNIGGNSLNNADNITTGTLSSARLANNQKWFNVNFIISGSGSAITTGVKGYFRVSKNGTLQMATLVANETGNMTVNIWKDSYANFPPTSADNITGGTPVTLSNANKVQNTTLAGWTTSVTRGDWFTVQVNSSDTVKLATLDLDYLES